jgi:hypothetical protein
MLKNLINSYLHKTTCTPYLYSSLVNIAHPRGKEHSLFLSIGCFLFFLTVISVRFL